MISETATQAHDRLAAEYTLVNGTIRSPGKFEAEPLYVPYYWEMANEGCADTDCGSVVFFQIGDDEREAFPELEEYFGIGLEESDNGFVGHVLFDTEEAWRRQIEHVEAQETE